MSWTNYHSHCYYCDGKYEPEKYVQSALNTKMLAYGFSSHAPLPFKNSWAMQEKDVSSYMAEINGLKQTYAGEIELYCGMEVDYIPGLVGPQSAFITGLNLDYTVGSVHFVDAFTDGTPCEIDGSHQVFMDGLQAIFNDDIEQMISRYFTLTRQMISESCPDVVGHMDKIKIQSEEGKLFSEDAIWYRQEVRETLDLIASTKAIIEVNTRGIYKKKTDEPYPSPWILEEICQRNIPITLCSDAHHPDEIVTYFNEAAQLLQQIGFSTITVLIDGYWQKKALSATGLHR